LSLALTAVGGAAAITGFACWINMLLAVCGVSPWASGSTEVPLSEPEAIAVDSRGNIYCELAAIRRIQVYDATGQFQRGWWIDAGSSGVVVMRVNRADQLMVACPGGRDYVFNSDGTLVGTGPLSRSLRASASEAGQATGPDGSRYEFRSPAWDPRIVKTDAEGREQIVVAVRSPAWIFVSPLPSWLLLPLGLLLLLAGGAAKSFSGTAS
jgi:hypothetical protein